MTSLDDVLVTTFGMPALALPWADRFFEPQELELIAALAAGPRPAADLLRELGNLTPEDLDRAARRGIVDDEQGAVALADFHARFELWAMFEGWKDVPADVADGLNEWELGHYAAELAPDLRQLAEGGEAPAGAADLAYLLLDEAEAIVRQVPHVYLWPCDCRSMFRRCAKPKDVCLRFDNNRGLGWEISAERAVEVLRDADRAGLVHTGYAGRPAEEAGAVCNCCTDCCFPHLTAERLEAAVWPRRRYRAAVQAEACTLCWRCTRRCPFEALTRAGGGAEPERLVFVAERCRGCGLCATGCPEDAIVMEPLGEQPPGVL